MSFTMSKFWNGAFKAEWSPGPGHATPITLGSTERGISFLSPRPEKIDIREDRFGDTIVDSFFLGHPDTCIVRIESLELRHGTGGSAVENLIYALGGLGYDSAGAVKAVSDPTVFGVGVGLLGQDIPTDFAGLLTLTAVTGKLLGTSTPMVLKFELAYPLEPVELLLSLRGPTRVPFGFWCYPTPDSPTAATAWRFFQATNAA